MKNEEVEKPFVDIVSGYNNGVRAVYIVGKDFLEEENRPELLGVPFLVWNGSWIPIGSSVDRAREIVGVPFISKNQMERLEEKMVTYDEGIRPEIVEVRGKEYQLDELGGSYVPYSFGMGHPTDVERRTRIRTLSDYDDLVQRVLPKVVELREERAALKAKDSNLVNKVLALIGMYRPNEFDRYQPLAAR